MTGHSALQAAITALDQADLGRADELFRTHLRQARNDASGLAHYGIFCVQTGQYEAAGYFLHKATKLLPDDADLLGQLGYAQLANRDFAAAKRTFDATLKLAPNHALAFNGLGLYFMQVDAAASAAQAFACASIAEPGNVAILVNAADAARHADNAASAIEYCERARTIAPRDPAVLLEYARCLRAGGEFERALQVLDAAAAQAPDQPAAILETSRCLRQLARYPQALALLEKLDRLNATAEYHEEMGHCLPSAADRLRRNAHWLDACTQWIDTQQFSHAELLLQRMLADDDANASAWNLHGISHEAQHRFEQAEQSFAKAIESDRECRDAYANLATLLEELNRVAEAGQIADSGLQVWCGADAQANPYIELCLVSARISRRQKNYPRGIEQLDRLAGFTLSDKQQELARFERGMLLDLLDQPAAAMAVFTQANAALRQRWMQANPGPNRFLAGVQESLELATRGWLDRWPAQNVARSGKDPVFLVGFPRSGTTLLNQILDCNSFIQTIEEKPTVAKMREIAACMPEGYPLAVPACDALDIEYLRDAYFAAAGQYCELDPAKVLVDKFPLQIVMVGLIHRVFPDARFIFSARHPCDVVLSCFMQSFRPNDAMANFYSIGETVALYTRTMDLWQLYRERLPIRVHTVHYANLVDDLDGETRKLCAYLDVPWQQSQADFATGAMRRGKIHTPSYAQVSRPIYREALHRWERYREFFSPWLSQLQPYIDRYAIDRYANGKDRVAQ